MNKLIKGNLVMSNVADKDIDMYVKYGWKIEKKQNKTKKKKENISEELTKESNVKNSAECNVIEE